MSNPAALGALVYEAESSFGEDVTTFSTFRLPITSPVDVSGLVHNKIDPARTEQYRQGGSQWILGTMGGSITTRMWLTGHGSATSGATSATDYETLLGIVFGNVTATAASGTTASAGTATALTTAASGTFTPGGIFWLGALGDARGNGQAGVVSTHATTTLTSLTAFGAAPSGSDVVHSGINLYPSESPTATTVTSVRFAAQTGNLSYELHGCVPTAITLGGFNAGDVPFIEVTWDVAWWRHTTSLTFPTTVATDTSNPKPVAAGSLFVNDVGTATRSASAVRTFRSFTVTYTLGMELLRGPGGANAYQDIIGARRTIDSVEVSWVEDADAATTTPVLTGWGTAETSKHVLMTCNTVAGARVAFYMPKVCISNVAVQFIDQNFNRLTITGRAYTGGTTTSALTLSAFRLAFG